MPLRTRAKLPRVDRRWLALHLQARRRKRAARPVDPLMVGLAQFYKPVGGSFVKSWNETEPVPENPFLGMSWPVLEAGGSAYQAQTGIQYSWFPYRQAAQRVYAGTTRIFDWTIDVIGQQVRWPAWTGWPTWVTGCSVMRVVNGVYSGFRDLTSGELQAGWVDAGAGWSAPTVMPCSFGAPPVTAKVLWNAQGWGFAPDSMVTVESPLGGVAFDSTACTRLARTVSADLRRDLDGTLAFWMLPGPYTAGVVAALRGVYTLNHACFYEQANTDFYFGMNYEITVTPHQLDDWYLVVLRNDTLTGRYRMDLMRKRDGAVFSGDATDLGTFAELTDDSDYYLEGMWAVLGIGGSGHWDEQGYAALDRIGVWTRVLTDDEVQTLFSCGLGWMPS